MHNDRRRIAAVAILAFLSLSFAAAEDDFIPVQISWVPMMAIPLGYGDVGLELGVVGALTRDVQGAAFSGVFTISRAVHGIQADGVFGLASADVGGLQSAGVFNIAGGAVHGAQFAGVFNISGDTVDGAQAAGVFNIASGTVEGAQMAGVFNIADRYRGPIQAAGVFNIASDFQGAQMSGVVNVAGTVRGAQLTSIVNVGEDVRGIQVGLVNVADTLTGIQLGLVNIVQHGVGGIGLAYDPVSEYASFFWQNGSRQLYSRLTVSRPISVPWGEPDGFVASFGLGSRGYLSPRAYGPWLDLDITSNWLLGPAMARLQDSMLAIRSDNPVCGPDDPRIGAAFADAAAYLPRWPWPSASLMLGLPVAGPLTALIGVRADVDFASWPAMPDEFRRGWDPGPFSLFGQEFRIYSKWFFGLRI